MNRELLVPIDGSEASLKALDVASIIARGQGASLRLLHVVPALAVPEGLKRYVEIENIPDPPRYVYDTAVADNVLNAGRDRAAANEVEHVEVAVAHGDVAERILEVANDEQVDMIVMGTRGLSDIQGLVLGSVAHKVAHGATCQVVMVK
jgi:nucleotide-binding universal stress UspA family protein